MSHLHQLIRKNGRVSESNSNKTNNLGTLLTSIQFNFTGNIPISMHPFGCQSEENESI